MVLHGLLADEESYADFLVAKTLGDELDDLWSRGLLPFHAMVGLHLVHPRVDRYLISYCTDLGSILTRFFSLSPDRQRAPSGSKVQ